MLEVGASKETFIGQLPTFSSADNKKEFPL